MSDAACDDCGGRLISWGGYWGWLRKRLEASQEWIGRRRCTGCGKTVAVLPPAALKRRLDAVETVGRAVAGKIDGASIRVVSADLELPVTTVRDWLRRHRQRAPELERDLTGWAIRMGAGVPWERPAAGERAAVAALRMAWHAASRRWTCRSRGVWQFWSGITRGMALATNRRPLFAEPRDRGGTTFPPSRAP